MVRFAIVQTPKTGWTFKKGGHVIHRGELTGEMMKETVERWYGQEEGGKELTVAHLRNGKPDLMHTVRRDA